MKNIIIVSVAVILLFNAACKKTSDTGNSNGNCLLTETKGTNSDIIYSYSSNGILTGITLKDLVNNTTTVFSATANNEGKVVQLLTPGDTINFTYNSNGKIASIFTGYIQAGIHYTQTETLTYNSNNQLSQTVMVWQDANGGTNNSYNVYTYANASTHNYSKVEEFNGMQGSGDLLVTYTYSSYDNYTAPDDFVSVLFGNAPTDNNPLTYTITYTSNNTSYNQSYAYQYSANGYPVQAVLSGQGITSPQTTVYSYSCH